MNKVKIIKYAEYHNGRDFETHINDTLEELDKLKASIKKVFLTAEPVTCLIWYEPTTWYHEKMLKDEDREQ